MSFTELSTCRLDFIPCYGLPISKTCFFLVGHKHKMGSSLYHPWDLSENLWSGNCQQRSGRLFNDPVLTKNICAFITRNCLTQIKSQGWKFFSSRCALVKGHQNDPRWKHDAAFECEKKIKTFLWTIDMIYEKFFLSFFI